MVKLTRDMALARCRSSELENVKKLNCWSNELDDISLMRQLTNVEVVSLSVNDITTLKDFQSCMNLQELYIRKNKIADLNEICYLKKLPKLRALWLADNPCATGSLYRMTVLRNLPNLTKLDNLVVESDELNDAIEQGVVLSLPNTSPDPSSEDSKSSVPENGSGETGRALSLAETNRVRMELGLKPLSDENIGTPSQNRSGGKQRNANILQSVLLLVDELDQESLQTVARACTDRLEAISDYVQS